MLCSSEPSVLVLCLYVCGGGQTPWVFPPAALLHSFFFKKGDFQTRTQKYTRLLAQSLSLSHTGMCFVNLSSKSSHWDYVGQMPAGCAVFKYSHPAPNRFHSGDEQNSHLVGTVS